MGQVASLGSLGGVFPGWLEQTLSWTPKHKTSEV